MSPILISSLLTVGIFAGIILMLVLWNNEEPPMKD